MEVADAYSLISSAIDTGHAANGYLFAGDLAEGEELVHKILVKLFPDAVNLVESGTHPDVLWLKPSGASRKIKVAKTERDPAPGMKDAMVEPMSVSSFSGGWKIGIIEKADRLTPEAANAFLKLLEEPPPQTMFLLLTDTPDAILPTIISRTQRVNLKLSDGILHGEAYSAVAEAFDSDKVNGTYAKAQVAKRLAAIYEELKANAEEEELDMGAVRKAFFRTLLSIARRWMIEEKLPRYQAFRAIEAIEEAYIRLERSMNAEAVLCFMCDRMSFPSGIV